MAGGGGRGESKSLEGLQKVASDATIDHNFPNRRESEREAGTGDCVPVGAVVGNTGGLVGALRRCYAISSAWCQGRRVKRRHGQSRMPLQPLVPLVPPSELHCYQTIHQGENQRANSSSPDILGPVVR